MPGFWEDSERAQVVLREKGGLERLVKDCDHVQSQLDDAVALLELAEEADDADTAKEAHGILTSLEGLIQGLETRRLLSEEHDSFDAMIEFNPGAGGTDACDWAQMLMRMYIRWAESRGLAVEILEESAAEEAEFEAQQ